MVGGTLSTVLFPSRARRSWTDAIDTVASTASDGAIVTTRIPSTVPSPMSPVPSMTATVVTRTLPSTWRRTAPPGLARLARAR